MSQEAASLEQIRQRIDDIDGQLLNLINARAECAQQVAQIKTQGIEKAALKDFYRPEREAQVLRRVKAQNQGPLDGEAIARLFREVMSACLALEAPVRVAYLGPAGTFTQMATIKHFGHAVIDMAMDDIDDIFREVESGACDYGVVPIENSTEGVINHTLDRFVRSPLCISGEVVLRIHHCLLGQANMKLAEVKRVYSHHQSLAQCRLWLDKNLPHAERMAVTSNAEAARLATEQMDAIAIAPGPAAGIYALTILQENIEDEPSNATRFLIIGKRDTQPSGKDKTTLLMSCPHEAGGLFTLLQPLARHHVNMNHIESRPSRQGVWNYIFFVDINGHQQDEHVAKAIAELRRQTPLFRVLGSYPQAVL